MASTPAFLAKQGTKISSDGSLTFTAVEDSRIYKAYCLNGTSGTASLRLTPIFNQAVETVNPTVQISQKFLNFGRFPQFDISSSGTDVLQGIGHLIYCEVSETTLNIPGPNSISDPTLYTMTYTKTIGGVSTRKTINYFASSGTASTVARNLQKAVSK